MNAALAEIIHADCFPDHHTEGTSKLSASSSSCAARDRASGARFHSGRCWPGHSTVDCLDLDSNSSRQHLQSVQGAGGPNWSQQGGDDPGGTDDPTAQGDVRSWEAGVRCQCRSPGERSSKCSCQSISKSFFFSRNFSRKISGTPTGCFLFGRHSEWADRSEWIPLQWGHAECTHWV